MAVLRFGLWFADDLQHVVGVAVESYDGLIILAGVGRQLAGDAVEKGTGGCHGKNQMG
jgi:hypothetical protein